MNENDNDIRRQRSFNGDIVDVADDDDNAETSSRRASRNFGKLRMTENYNKYKCNYEDEDNIDNYEDNDNIDYDEDNDNDETSSRRASRNFGMFRITEASIAGTK